MREILFRGKSVNDGRWIYGDLSNYGDCKTITTVKDFSIIDSCEVIPETVGQYTGLKDLHGTRIFEADIVKVYDVYCNETVVGVVEFCDGSFRIYDKDFTSYDRWMYCKVEVIGNVYDNQELLKGE